MPHPRRRASHRLNIRGNEGVKRTFGFLAVARANYSGLLPLVALCLLTVIAAPQARGETVKLYGSLDALQSACAELGLSLSRDSHHSMIESVKLGSPAAYAGLRAKDAVLSCTLQDHNTLVITIQRDGKTYQVSLGNQNRSYTARTPQSDTVPIASKPTIPDLTIEQPTIPELHVPDFDDDADISVGPDGYPTLNVRNHRRQCNCHTHI